MLPGERVLFVRHVSRILDTWLQMVQAQWRLRSKSATVVELLEACRQRSEGQRGTVDIAEVAVPVGVRFRPRNILTAALAQASEEGVKSSRPEGQARVLEIMRELERLPSEPA